MKDSKITLPTQYYSEGFISRTKQFYSQIGNLTQDIYIENFQNSNFGKSQNGVWTQNKNFDR